MKRFALMAVMAFSAAYPSSAWSQASVPNDAATCKTLPGGGAYTGKSPRVRVEHVDDFNVVVLTPERFTPTASTPVVYLVHGANQREDCLLSQTDLIAFTAGQPAQRQAVVVMPFSGFSAYWIDWRSGRFHDETRFFDTLIPTIEGRYGGIRPASKRAIAGFSAGGFGALHLAAHRPDRFAAAASFSGVTDMRETTPLSLGAGISETGPPPAVELFPLFGDPVTQAVHWRDASPLDLSPNLGTLSLHVFTGNGVPCDRGDVSQAAGFLPYSLLEPFAHDYAVRFHKELDRVGVAHAYDAGCGMHLYGNVQRDLHRWWGPLFQAFNRPPPKSFDHRRATPSFSVYGWRFDADPRRADEFLEVKDASASGVTLTGSGLTTVTTAGLFGTGETVNLEGAVAPAATADGDGRITFTVNLGPPHPNQQYTLQARLAGEDKPGYFTARHVTFEEKS